MTQGFTRLQTVPGTTNIAPTVQKFTSGSGTYTKPAGVLYLKVTMVGGGGGGAGGSNNGTGGTGGTGGNTTFGSSFLVANGGVGGTGSGPDIGGLGGTASLGTAIGIAQSGSQGGSTGSTATANTYVVGGHGGVSPLGGAGAGHITAAGYAAVTNSGSGGGGGGAGSGGGNPGAGGGSGGYVHAFVTNPSSTYSYAVGAAGTAGTAGTSGFAGGAGGSGQIIVEEYYQ